MFYRHAIIQKNLFFVLRFLATFDWPADTWIKANHEQYGYYRVNYERDNWGKLAQVLQDDHMVFIIK